jgi:hypothetical protein
MGLVHLKWEGANSHAVIAPEQPLPEKANYLIGNDPSQWHTNLSAYGRVHYQNLYPGIDLVFYGNQTQLEYDFVVAPHADPKTINISIQGADQIAIEADGSLAFSVQGRVTRFNSPAVYQIANGARRDIAAGYKLRGNSVSFMVGAYDEQLPLVIDPVLSYSTFLGGLGIGTPMGVAVDSAGSAYVCGYTTSTLTNLVTPGAFQTTNRGGDVVFPSAGSDCFVAKIGSAGTNLLYYTFLGSSEEDVAYGITVDSFGNAYLTGYTLGDDFPITANAFTSTNRAYADNLKNNDNDGQEGFITKLNTNGSQLIYSTYLGNSYGSLPAAIALDAQNNIYVGGMTLIDFPVTNAIQPTSDLLSLSSYSGDANVFDRRDGFITELSSNGQYLVYSTIFTLRVIPIRRIFPSKTRHKRITGVAPLMHLRLS